MSDMKCPFCGGELEEEKVFTGKRERIFVCCDGENCPITDWGGCSKQIITELIRTKKQLEIAIDALKYANKCIKGGCVNWETEIDKALEQITALEQKDK